MISMSDEESWQSIDIQDLLGLGMVRGLTVLGNVVLVGLSSLNEVCRVNIDGWMGRACDEPRRKQRQR